MLKEAPGIALFDHLRGRTVRIPTIGNRLCSHRPLDLRHFGWSLFVFVRKLRSSNPLPFFIIPIPFVQIDNRLAFPRPRGNARARLLKRRKALRRPRRSCSPRSTLKATINRELAVLSHLFNKAIEWGWITVRPAKICRFHEGQGRITYLTVEQIQRLIECAKQDQNQNIYPFIVIGLETSMRKMEILSIRREHVDLDRHTIFIPKAKAGMREQPITSHLADFLKGYIDVLPKGTPWLFPSIAAEQGHTINILKPFRRVVTAAGLNPKEVVRHTLRHTAITHLVQAGVDLPTVKRISGHKTLTMVERHVHQNGEHIQAAMDKLQNRLKFTE